MSRCVKSLNKNLTSLISLLTLGLFLMASFSTYASEEVVERDLNSTASATEAYSSSPSNSTESDSVDVGTPAGEAKDNLSGGFKKVGEGFKDGAKATGRGFKKAGLTTGRAFKKAGVATGRGFKKFGSMVKNFFTGKKSESHSNRSDVEEKNLSSSETYEAAPLPRENQDLDAVGNDAVQEDGKGSNTVM